MKYTGFSRRNAVASGTAPPSGTGSCGGFGMVPEIVALVQAAIETANLSLPEVAHIRAFRLIAETLTSEDAEVTPTLTLKRRLVSTRYADLIDDIYGGADRQEN